MTSAFGIKQAELGRLPADGARKALRLPAAENLTNCRLLRCNNRASLLDHLVGGGEHIGRHREAERLRGLAVEKSVQNLSGWS